MNIDTNGAKNAESTVAEFLAIFSTGNVPAILDAMHDDATWWVSGQIEGMSGTYAKTTLGELLVGAKTIYKSGALRITPLSMISQGSKVAVEAESYAELTDGRVYNNFYHFLFEVVDGKIFRVREYMDTLHAKQIFFG